MTYKSIISSRQEALTLQSISGNTTAERPHIAILSVAKLHPSPDSVSGAMLVYEPVQKPAISNAYRSCPTVPKRLKAAASRGYHEAMSLSGRPA